MSDIARYDPQASTTATAFSRLTARENSRNIARRDRTMRTVHDRMYEDTIENDLWQRTHELDQIRRGLPLALRWAVHGAHSLDPIQPADWAPAAGWSWTTLHLRQISHLAEHIITSRTWLYHYLLSGQPENEATHYQTAVILIEPIGHLAAVLTRGNITNPLEAAMAWAPLLAAIPNDAAFRAFAQFSQTSVSGWELTASDNPPIYQWLRYAHRDTAPLAWAAGLSFTESCHQSDANTPDVSALAALAALRGWRFPTPTSVSPAPR